MKQTRTRTEPTQQIKKFAIGKKLHRRTRRADVKILTWSEFLTCYTDAHVEPTGLVEMQILHLYVTPTHT